MQTFYYIVYKTINLINNREYIGVHVTSDLDDKYIGSGFLLKLAIKKYGRENFKKTILHIFDNRNDMMKMERELVNEDYVERLDTYNIELGGLYHSDYTKEKIGRGNKGKIRTIAHRKFISIRTKECMTEEVRRRISEKLRGRKLSESQKEKMRVRMLGENNPFYGKTHSEESRKIMSENSFNSRMKGENHPLTGVPKSEEMKKNLSDAMRNSEKHKEVVSSDEYKLKMSEIVKNRPKKECQYCGKMIDPGNYAKLHGEKCKMNSQPPETQPYVG